ncbi:N-glycosylase/DNA lyase [Tindallia magadiensis]|uniref:DNA-(apurinic or apyrimidinic site) lyase n=1 Tax=Tindallia magadiensis TaxID=69895 RepID=A0A1I3FF46_9FIRM|nr:DNA glycosylase [Tindallia magadiensis]SFI09814.1 N-glycosylase/DNA lyase [Tindallia magadiensis]
MQNRHIVEVNKNELILNIEGFDPYKSFECGQCFRWHHQPDGSYTGVVSNRVLNVRCENQQILLKGTSLSEFHNFWAHYFDLNTNYDAIQKRLIHKTPWIKAAISSGNGIHIFHQDLWEIFISFIISSNNNISRISQIIESISQLFGEKLASSLPGQWFSFPKPVSLNQLTEKDWRELNVGYRAPYLVSAVASWHIFYQEVNEMLRLKGKDSTLETSRSLQKIPGIGPKVASCIQLFGTPQRDVFPIDVWVRRAMMHFYSPSEKQSDLQLQKDALHLFGDDAGFAQQYLFFHARSYFNKH